MAIKPETGFFKHCIRTAKRKGLPALTELIHYLETNDSVSIGYDLTQKEALEIAISAKADRERDIMIQHQFIK